jgi:hypothetical protein
MKLNYKRLGSPQSDVAKKQESQPLTVEQSALLVYLGMLLPNANSFQIQSAIAKSVKASWLEKSDDSETISYKQNMRPISLHTLSIYNYKTNLTSASVFFVKNNAIYVHTYHSNKIVLPLYDYIKDTYSLLELYRSQFHSVNEYVKNSNGELCLLYEGRTKGIYNFSTRKTIYETDALSFWLITYPLANSISIVLRRDSEWENIYIDIVSLLNADKHEISYPIRQHLRSLLKDYLQELAKGHESKKHKKYIEKLIKQGSIESLPFEEKISPSKVNYAYLLDVALSKVVFCKSLTIQVGMEYKIATGRLSLEAHNTLVIHCFIEEDGVAITIETGESNSLVVQDTYIDIDMPPRTLLNKKYRIEIPKDLSKSCLYAVSDLFDNYVILEDKICKLSSSNGNEGYSGSEYGTLNNVLRVDNANIYEILDNTGKKLLVRFRPKPSDKKHKLGSVVVFDDSYQVQVLNLDTLCDILNVNEYSYNTKNQQHIDATTYLIKANAWPMINSKVKTGESCEDENGRIREHKIYFYDKTGDSYLFLYTSNYNITTGFYSHCISVYKYKTNSSKINWRKVLTLGPYKYRMSIISSDKLLPMLTKDLAIAGYNILLYPNFLSKLVEGKNQIANVFVYKGEISFKFDDSDTAHVYANVVDTIYNRRNNFIFNKYNQSIISNIKRNGRVILCFEQRGKEIVCSPFILSEIELVKPIPLIA